MGILDWLSGRRKPSSGEIAKERLQLVLAYDRGKISPELLQTLENELITVISKHVEIDREGVEVTFSRGKRHNRLIADIPLIGALRQRK
ncbi:MAG: cell division topological specificity factor MinE [Anaerolineales bacterium]|nr:cell division topological specificity factor MinE [Anaerolineales bacterium]